MKRKIRLLASSLTVMAFVLVLTNSCKKEDSNNNNIVYNQNLTYGTVTDVEGNIYKTITIGTQTWMAENLKVTHYRNGKPIQNITIDTIWYKLTTGAYCDYEYNGSNSIIYGKLYNCYAVQDSQNIAPIGWHIPTSTDWITLQDYLGGQSFGGGKLKEISTKHWKSPNSGASNESGFTALPGGRRDKTFNNIGSDGYWWSSSNIPPKNTNATFMTVTNQIPWLMISCDVKSSGFSVRCIKDK